MTKSALPGPLIIYGDRNALGTGATGSNNADKAPSLVWGGTGLIDPRVGYNTTRYGAIGFSGVGDIPVVDAVPSTIADNNIAASQLPVSGTAMTMVSATGAGVTVLAAATVVWASGNTIAANSLALDGAPGLVTFGLANLSTGFTCVSLYDPTKALARNVRVTTNGDDTGGFYTIAGGDLYGYPMTEKLTGVNNSIVSGKKAFKFVYSVTPSGTINSTLSKVGTGDVYGFPIRVDTIGYITLSWNASLVTANTGWLAAITTDPATNTTGDVRGTYAVQSASDNSKRLQAFVAVSVANIGTTTGLFGVTQA